MPSFTYTPIVAKAHTPPYKIHKYFARRPHNVFNQLIENFTSPGEIILDPFCGGGVTIYEASYPTFNVADVCIVSGAILGAIYYVLIYEKHDRRKTDGASDPANGQ